MAAHARLFCCVLSITIAAFAGSGCSTGQLSAGWRVPEQAAIKYRDVSEFPLARLPDDPAPPTVSSVASELPPKLITLDDAIRLALERSDVIRVLAGVTAVSSGRTIYDPAIANTAIDNAQARFDPRLEVRNHFSRTEQPQGVFDLNDPRGSRIAGTGTDAYDFSAALAKTTATGAELSLDLFETNSRFGPGTFPLDPQNRFAAQLTFEQPILQGGGIAPNLAPIVIARIDTERSFFQFKDTVQELVRGVIEVYWSVVFARTDVWARRQQVEQGRAAFERANARRKQGLGDAGEVAQARLALANFQASLIGAEANLLDREAAMRNLLGIPPNEPTPLIPTTPPSADRLDIEWDQIVNLAAERRPDLIELKLIIEADEQLLLQAQNQALPRVNAVAQYRWNGIEGETPSGARIASRGDQFTDWTLGVNFSVPLGLRQGRATLRRQELVIDRDRANLEQGLHGATHELAIVYRNLAQFYERYEAFREARAAARLNLDQQLADFRAGRTIFLNVLQAITDWGNAVSAEAQMLALYNTELANLERSTGSILETHSIHFYEERFTSIGPFNSLAGPRCYPLALPPAPNADRYASQARPAEEFFKLEDPTTRPAEPDRE